MRARPCCRSTSGVSLVVDDDEDLRNMIADALELEGYVVVCAEDGEEALRQVRVSRRA